MAELVGIFAASHGPIIARNWETMPRAHRDKLAAAFDELGRRLKAAKPDLLVVVSPDHWVNFFINNLPAVCIGIGDEHDGPPEPFMKKVYPHPVLKGHAAFGRHLLQTALDNDFEPALSHRLRLDHGACIPLWRAGVPPDLPLVPILVNDLEAPMPSIRRCLAWGRLLRRAIETYPEPLRVAVLGTGGLSHSIGEATMGWIDEKFDHACIKHFQDGEEQALDDFLTRALPQTGNGAHEMRDWVIAHGAAGGTGFELIDYFPSPETLVGAGFASWKLPASELGPSDQRSRR
jgi:aromatic ring-opening dioxygenase catalytic subunit (LigB family)